MLNKGFIGPIGDDLPSLIPLLVGLVLFFSTFTLTFNSFDTRNTEFNDDIMVMRISRVLQSNSYIYGYDNFTELCEEVGLISLDYVAGISAQATSDIDDNAPPKNIFDVEFFENKSGDVFYCTNTGIDSSNNLISDFLDLEEATNAQVVSRIFPIVLEDEKIVKPMHLFVVAWK
ncbi:MAG: hypothetical protein NUV57_02385 [archaeon]|nr:hypothetical protein [archaeon]